MSALKRQGLACFSWGPKRHSYGTELSDRPGGGEVHVGNGTTVDYQAYGFTRIT